MELTGKVGLGKGYGRTLGFPTANIPLNGVSLSGIYAGRVRIPSGETFLAALYADGVRGILEAHLLDWTGDVYGQEIEITVGEKIRDAAAFSSEIALMTAIAEDVARVRALRGA